MSNLKSRADVEKLVRRGAHLAALLGCAIAQRDADVLAAQNKHSALIAQLSKDITAITDDVEQWASANRKAEFAGEQTLELPEGVLAFNKGKRSVDTLPGWDEDKALQAMTKPWIVQAITKAAAVWLRMTVDINKTKILADSKGERPKLTAERLAKVGLRIKQDESFNVEFRAAPPTLKAAAQT